MAGGTWTSQNKVRPGAYIVTRTQGMSAGAEGVSGVVALPLVFDSGAEKTVLTVTGSTNLQRLIGQELSDEALAPLREALKGASTVLLYRVNGGTRASVELFEGATARAVFSGSKGNEITIVIQPNIDNSSAFDVITFLGSNIVDEQENVVTISDLENNSFVEFSGEGNLEAVAGLTLEGGESQEATASDYADFFEDVAVYDFNVLAIPVNDEEIKIAGANFVKELRDEEGKKCQVVVYNYRGDHEAIINLKNLAVIDERTLTPAETVAGVAGLQAGASFNESLTYSSYPGATDVSPRYSNSEIISALRAGELVLVLEKERVVIEQDINSLVSFTTDKNQDFRKNRILRTLDEIANNTREVFNRSFVGSVDNNADGRSLFLGNRIAYFESLQDQNAIDDFASDDVTIAEGEEKDAVFVEAWVRPVDAMEKLYMTVRVR